MRRTSGANDAERRSTRSRTGPGRWTGHRSNAGGSAIGPAGRFGFSAPLAGSRSRTGCERSAVWLGPDVPAGRLWRATRRRGGGGAGAAERRSGKMFV